MERSETSALQLGPQQVISQRYRRRRRPEPHLENFLESFASEAIRCRLRKCQFDGSFGDPALLWAGRRSKRTRGWCFTERQSLIFLQVRQANTPGGLRVDGIGESFPISSIHDHPAASLCRQIRRINHSYAFHGQVDAGARFPVLADSASLRPFPAL